MKAPALRLAVAVMLLVNLLPCAWGLHLPNYDAETHLFMADHYRNSWFDPWEPRWFGGFWMFSYPPLVHQLVALLSWAVGLEAAYVVVELVVLLALPVALWLLTREVAGRHAADQAALFGTASAGVYLCLYMYGQLPTLAALDLMLASGAFLLRWLRGARALDLAAWALLGGATLGTHHLTGIAALSFLAIALTLQGLAETRRPAVLARALAAALALALVSALVLLPFGWWMATCHRPQAQIQHASRMPFLSMPDQWYVMFVGIWGGGLLALAPALWISARRPALACMTALVLFWGTLGLGYYTRLPHLVFPGWAHWLTYERFTLWASVLVLVPLGARLAESRRLAACAWLVVFSAFAIFSASTPLWVRFMPPPPDDIGIEAMARFLDHEGRARWHYVTIGLGEQAMARLSRTTAATTIDGLYFTARRNEYFNQIGMGPFDSGQWIAGRDRSFWAQQSVLARPQLYGIKWGIASGPYGNKQFETARWRRLGWIGAAGFEPAGDGPLERSWRVTVWQAPGGLDIPTVDEMDPRPVDPPFPLALLWGTAPLAILASGVWTAARALRRDA